MSDRPAARWPGMLFVAVLLVVFGSFVIDGAAVAYTEVLQPLVAFVVSVLARLVDLAP